MQVQLTSDQAALVHQAIENGRYSRAEDVLKAALLLWEKQERRRSEILSAVDQAEASFLAGAGRLITTQDETRLLASDIKRRGLARLSAEAMD